MSDEATLLLFRHVIALFESSPPGARRTFTKDELESKAEEAAFIINAGMLAQSEVPFSDDLLKEKWLDPYAAADATLVLEVQCTLGQKDPQFLVRTMSKLKEACQTQCFIKNKWKES